MDWIRKQARLYRNLAITGRYQAVVHLEDKEDEPFWDSQLQHAHPGRYRYIYYSNGRPYLEEVRQRFDKALEALTETPSELPHLTEDNAYLHIQGHQLYKLILHIGTLLGKGKNMAFKSEILDKGLQASGYEEIELLQRDLNVILNK